MRTSFTIRHDMISMSTVDLVEIGPEMLITRIFVPYKYRGKGFASKLLKEVLEAADSDGVTLMLDISPSGGLEAEELRDWYLRNGFEQFSLAYRMSLLRKPKSSTASKA